MKIQQMAFMIVAVFIFFTLVGLFFVSWQSRSIGRNAADLQKQQALSSIEVIRNMPELNCDLTEGLCVDEDKLNVLAAGLSDDYAEFWPVASVKVYKVYPAFDVLGAVKCPALNCNYWEIYDSNQQSSQEFSGYINICKKIREFNSPYTKCEVGKIVVGSILKNE